MTEIKKRILCLFFGHSFSKWEPTLMDNGRFSTTVFRHCTKCNKQEGACGGW
jgi:hypothetical protein